MKLIEKIIATTLGIFWLAGVIVYFLFWLTILWLVYKVVMWVIAGGLG